MSKDKDNKALDVTGKELLAGDTVYYSPNQSYDLLRAEILEVKSVAGTKSRPYECLKILLKKIGNPEAKYYPSTSAWVTYAPARFIKA